MNRDLVTFTIPTIAGDQPERYIRQIVVAICERNASAKVNLNAIRGCW